MQNGYVPNNLRLPQGGQFWPANEGDSLPGARSFGAETGGGRIRLPQAYDNNGLQWRQVHWPGSLKYP
jgi:hypothetical protein